ncbi:CapA family protein [Thomasclavelia saccharogumia]|uniref:CapA family protein n=1 Tax=Thomasclavelia saccharogumia TaxID=341225 RepID=UPI00047AE288|nr:CapA family protein [Thomasclavelia saccharogumia]
MKKILLCLIMLFFIVGCSFITEEESSESTENDEKVQTEEKKEPVKTSVKLSFAGDCTLGNYAGQVYDGSFNQEYAKQGSDVAYFLKNVKSVFEDDDLTIVNLEGPLTNATSHAEKQFPFSGPKEYADILTSGSVELVSLANNHSEDYYAQGMKDTKQVLDEKKIGYFGYETACVKEVKGIKIGFLGYRSMSLSMNNEQGRATIKNAIDDLKNNQGANTIVVFYHWGIEREYYANSDQRELAKFTIDSGADLVMGSHPHVVQGVEEYNGKQIVYSLGNFCFGGNRNPSDTDSMIYSITMNFTDGNYTGDSHEIIPCSITSVKGRNNYQPMILDGSEKQRVLDKIQKYSY